MGTLGVEPESGRGWDELVRLREETDAPEGCKVELIEGTVTVSPTPANSHNSVAQRVQRQLYTVIPEDWGVYQTLAVAIPSRLGMFIPDLVVAPEAALDEPGHYIPAAAALLVVEITSKSNANHDRIEKLHGYATAGVPWYLLLDGCHSGLATATLYGQPRSAMYRVLDTVKYGEGLHIPAPFDLTIDTGAFPAG
ncbi:Uma2 family endonuclease [Streptomyces tirandamycinicus]|uniref:Uma2 family endonuclease n=1 Tax=Streptomyces tirandamycinicus TaxID=2174846 RepID=UPI00226EED49|nr:Uma2 family endonuclease [Streptomyces tirandamycinicus]MCY0982528.1 Uma2 family endonuclease [Streptomyces tirandamycinicus]